MNSDISLYGGGVYICIGIMGKWQHYKEKELDSSAVHTDKEYRSHNCTNGDVYASADTLKTTKATVYHTKVAAPGSEIRHAAGP